MSAPTETHESCYTACKHSPHMTLGIVAMFQNVKKGVLKNVRGDL